MSDPSKEPWHLDKRVPIATLAVLVIQFALGVMWITTISNNVSAHSEALLSARNTAQAHEARIRAVEIAQASQSSDLRAIQSSLTRIEAAVERLQPKP